MPLSIQIAICAAILAGVAILILWFYLRNQAQIDALFARIGRAFLFVGGANWRTSLTAFVTALCAVLTGLAALPQELGAVADIIPVNWKARLAIGSLICGSLAHVLNGVFQKDKSVTGGRVTQDATGNVATIQPSIPQPPEPALPKSPDSL